MRLCPAQNHLQPQGCKAPAEQQLFFWPAGVCEGAQPVTEPQQHTRKTEEAELQNEDV